MPASTVDKPARTPEDDIEIAVEGEEQKPPDEAASGGDDLEVDVASDPLYEKPDWKIDPAENIDDPEDEKYGSKVSKRIGKLRASLSEAAKQRDKERLEKEEATRLARDYMTHAQQLQAQFEQLQKEFQSGASQYYAAQVDKGESVVSLAQRELKEALNAGDADAAAKAQEKLSRASVQAELAKQQVESRKVQQQQQQAELPQQQNAQLIAYQAAHQARLQSWRTNNDWFDKDQDMTDHAMAVHNRIFRAGTVEIGGDEYYKAVDGEMRKKFPDKFGIKKPNAPLAPTSKSNPQQANQNGKARVTLTPSQVSMANRLGLTPQQYAKQLLKMRNEGADV